MRLESQLALVTGTAMGTAKAITELFAQEGASVISAHLHEEGERTTAEEIHQAGGRCLFQRTDIGVESEVETLAALGIK
jgi:NAD(P)-dependent dehydrogenase (short-subunit alcohol dehydrogenase family)